MAFFTSAMKVGLKAAFCLSNCKQLYTTAPLLQYKTEDDSANLRDFFKRNYYEIFKQLHVYVMWFDNHSEQDLMDCILRGFIHIEQAYYSYIEFTFPQMNLLNSFAFTIKMIKQQVLSD